MIIAIITGVSHLSYGLIFTALRSSGRFVSLRADDFRKVGADGKMVQDVPFLRLGAEIKYIPYQNGDPFIWMAA